MEIKRGRLFWQGETNNVYLTNVKEILEVESTDKVFSKQGNIAFMIDNKGVTNNKISMYCFELLSKNSINNSFFSTGTNEKSRFVKRLDMFMFKVVCRLHSSARYSKRVKCEEGIKFDTPVIEFLLKSSNGFVKGEKLIEINAVTKEELEFIENTTLKVSDLLSKHFDALGIKVIDFRFDFGTDDEGNIVVGGEISPDTCRFIDKETGKKLNKDLINENITFVKYAYKEVLEKIVK